jgi:NitT/TauT family transport system permease protein
MRLIIFHRYKLISILSVLVVLGAWQASAGLGLIREQLTSSPSGVVSAFGQLVSSGQLGSALLVSAKLFGVGLGIAIIIGTIVGIAIGWWPVMNAIFEPFISMLYAMPIIALLPIILVWFGITFKAQVVMVVLVSVFPVLVSVITATRHVDPQLLRLARSLRASELQIMRTIVLPSLVPYLIAGIRLAVGGALIGVVVAEYFLGQAGIGGLIVQEGEVLKTGDVLVGVFILALVSVVISALLKAVERRLTGWR